MSTEQQRQQWRELAAAATPGEWETVQASNDTRIWCREWLVALVPNSMTYYDTPHNSTSDAAFIAAARAAVPALLADVDAAERERDNARACIERYDAIIVALRSERDALAAELERVRAQLATVDDFGADCYVWGLDNKTWRPDFTEWSQWKHEVVQPPTNTPTPTTR